MFWAQGDYDEHCRRCNLPMNESLENPSLCLTDIIVGHQFYYGLFADSIILPLDHMQFPMNDH